MPRVANPEVRNNPPQSMLKKYRWVHVNDAIAEGLIKSYESAYAARYKDEKAGIVGRFWTRYDGLYINSNYPSIDDTIPIEELYFKLADKLGATKLYRLMSQLTGWSYGRIYSYFRTFRFDRESVRNKYYQALQEVEKVIST